MRYCILLLAALTGFQEDDPLLEKLKSSDPAVSEAATEEMVKLGAGEKSRLEKLARNSDPEVRKRAEWALKEIGRRDRLRWFHPDTKRLTLELKELPVVEAAKRVFGPFGIETQVEKHLTSSKVCLALKDATLWEALDAFCLETKLKPGLWGMEQLTVGKGWFFSDDWTDDPTRVINKGDVRIAIAPGTITVNDVLESVSVRINAQVAPGHRPIATRVDDIAVTDDGGRKPGFKSVLIEDRSRGPVTLGMDGITAVRALDMKCPIAGLQKSRRLTLEGKLVLIYPHDVEITEIALKSGEAKIECSVAQSKLIISSFKAKPGKYSIEMGVKADDADKEIRLFLELRDDAGRTLHNFGGVKRLEDVRTNLSSSSSGTEVASKLVIMRVIGADEVTIPFVVKDIPVPELDK